MLVVAQRLEREHVGAALLEPHHAGGPARPAGLLDQPHVGVEVLERPGDRGDERARGGEREADRAVGQPVRLEREVVLAAPEPLVPARRERADDALEGLLHAVGVGEVVAAQPQLEGRKLARAPAAVHQT